MDTSRGCRPRLIGSREHSPRPSWPAPALPLVCNVEHTETSAVRAVRRRQHPPRRHQEQRPPARGHVGRFRVPERRQNPRAFFCVRTRRKRKRSKTLISGAGSRAGETRALISAIPQLGHLPLFMAPGPGVHPRRRATNVTAAPVIPARIPESRARDECFSDPAECRRSSPPVIMGRQRTNRVRRALAYCGTSTRARHHLTAHSGIIREGPSERDGVTRTAVLVAPTGLLPADRMGKGRHTPPNDTGRATLGRGSTRWSKTTVPHHCAWPDALRFAARWPSDCRCPDNWNTSDEDGVMGSM